MNTDKIKELERKVTELKQSISPHSVKPEMLVNLEELEEELEKEKSKGERLLVHPRMVTISASRISGSG